MRAEPRIEIRAIYLCGNGEQHTAKNGEDTKKQRWIIYYSDLEHSFEANWTRGGKWKRVLRWTMPRPGAYCSLFTFDSGERHFYSFFVAGNLWPGVCLFVCNRMRFNSVQRQQQTTATDSHRFIGFHTFDAFGHNKMEDRAMWNHVNSSKPMIRLERSKNDLESYISGMWLRCLKSWLPGYANDNNFSMFFYKLNIFLWYKITYDTIH